MAGGLALLVPGLMFGCTQEPRVTFLANEAYYEALLSHLTQATREIVVSMFLFAPGDHEEHRVNRVKATLINAAKRGVRVQLFLDVSDAEDFSTETNRRVAQELSRHGVTVQLDSPARTTHTKLVVIDQRYVLLGSHNFTQSALRYNNEASVLIDSPALARQALAYLQDIRALRGDTPAPGSARRRQERYEGR